MTRRMEAGQARPADESYGRQLRSIWRNPPRSGNPTGVMAVIATAEDRDRLAGLAGNDDFGFALRQGRRRRHDNQPCCRNKAHKPAIRAKSTADCRKNASVNSFTG